MKRIVLTNEKGGVGKTTTVLNIGFGLARHFKKNVLLIDLDAQGNLTAGCGLGPADFEATVHDLLSGQAKLSEVILEHRGLSLIPANRALIRAESDFHEIGREFLLREALEPLNSFDYVLFDTPPSLGIMTINALTAAHEVYIPMQLEYFSLQGLRDLLRTIETVQKRLNAELEVSGIIANRFDGRKNLSHQVIATLKKHFGERLFKTFIRDNVAIAESPGFGLSVFEYKKNSNGAKDFLKLCQEIIKRGEI